MENCALHGISPNLCGCVTETLRPERGDSHRDFSELEVGARVRFAGKLREVELCECGLRGVRVEDPRPRMVPMPEGGSQRRLRVSFVHDALVGPTGYTANVHCVWFEKLGKRK